MSTRNLLAPCSNCRHRHQKCAIPDSDRRQPICRRCEIKGLNCRPAQRMPVFRHGTTANLDANFREDQTWVNSRPKNWRPSTRSARLSQSRSSPTVSNEDPNESALTLDSPLNGQSQAEHYSNTLIFGSAEPNENSQNESSHAGSFSLDVTRPAVCSTSPANVSNSSVSSGIENGFEREQFYVRSGGDFRNAKLDSLTTTSSSVNSSYSVNRGSEQGSSNVQEACLMRYFIEELSPWFDHCDERRHFQLVVPRRAKYCAALRNAVFAVSSRHLCRLPQYTTLQGSVYHGQALPGLTKSTSLEYMLKCVPELIQFPEIQDPIHQENIMAATVILRQYEEMEEEMEEMEEGEIGNHANERVNFLAITQTIIDTMISTPLDHSLATAAYWIAIRQEVYYALTRQRAPQFRFDSGRCQNASVANTMIIFASEVAKWRWGLKETHVWEQLKAKQQRLHYDYLHELAPILEQDADRARGDIFPTIWYSFDAQVTAIQHLKLAEMILIAESPYLENARGALHRKTEAQVRTIVLSLCGIALNHPQCQPALVNAVIAITLYGEYFVQQEERDALLDIINQTMKLHAWPLRKAYQSLQRQWDMIDNVQL